MPVLQADKHLLTQMYCCVCFSFVSQLKADSFFFFGLAHGNVMKCGVCVLESKRETKIVRALNVLRVCAGNCTESSTGCQLPLDFQWG